ncbi:hypothetical protein GCM10009092_21280 [Bowmanella denitrificans]|uniref:Peptidase S54 rhomboid domain-containing protein n=1 Tax=Bowmanella denitrificans TaxID=366582 RepID=A0ABP3GWU3_9ALTE
MLKLPCQPQQFSGPLLVLLLSFLFYFLEPWSQVHLTYDRTMLQSGEWWRLLSGHLLHTNFNHLLLNAAGMLLLWALHGHYYRFFPYLGLMLCCALICSIGLYWGSPELIRYVGLSGILHGLFAWGAGMDIRHGIKSGWLLLMGLWGKVLYEQWAGPSQEVAKLINANVAIDAHLFGALAGMLALAASVLTPFIKKRRTR